MPKGQTLEERFLDKISPEPMSGCWLWTGAMTGKSSTSIGGYGVIRLGKDGGCRQVYAHQVSYMLYHGDIPDGLEIDHLCSTRLCVNPSHLEAVTAKVNTRRIHERGRCPNHFANKTHCPQGHPYSGDNLYTAPGGGRLCIACRRERDRKRARKRSVENA